MDELPRNRRPLADAAGRDDRMDRPEARATTAHRMTIAGVLRDCLFRRGGHGGFHLPEDGLPGLQVGGDPFYFFALGKLHLQ